MPLEFGRTLFLLGWGAILCIFALRTGIDIFSGARIGEYAVIVFFFLLIPIVHVLLEAVTKDVRQSDSPSNDPLPDGTVRMLKGMRGMGVLLLAVGLARFSPLSWTTDTLCWIVGAMLAFRTDARVAFIFAGSLFAAYPFLQAGGSTVAYALPAVTAAETFVALGLLQEALERFAVHGRIAGLARPLLLRLQP